MHKVFSKRTTWLQLRRVGCGHCHQDFVYLARGAVGAVSQGAGWISLFQKDQRFIDEVEEKTRDKLRAIESAKRIGRARCPNCGRYQRWMWFPRGSIRNVLFGLILGPVLMAMLTGVLMSQVQGVPESLMLFLGVGVGPIGGAALGYWLALRAGGSSSAHPDPAAMTLADFEQLQAEARAREVQPELAWAEELGKIESTLLNALHAINSVAPTAYGLEVLSARLAEDGGFL